jgi:Arc/MetJ-type ribon-helix-helix transcriptional regulator
MSSAKIAISIEASLLQRIDALVNRKLFRSRSEVFQLAVAEQIERFDDDILARECAKLDPTAEQAFADIGLSKDISEWPEY